MVVDFLRRGRTTRRLVYRLGRGRGEDLAGRIAVHLRHGESILDIGCGTCHVSESLRCRGFETVPIDVRDVSFVDGIAPRVYDGSRLPFGDGSFDVGLLITVLHHTPDPVSIVREAARVCRRLVIIEDIYRTMAGKYFTFVMDSLMNLEFIGHPHTNKTDAGWKAAFAELGLQVLDTAYQRSFVFFTHATYHLGSEANPGFSEGGDSGARRRLVATVPMNE